jgi:hypothetical protein
MVVLSFVNRIRYWPSKAILDWTSKQTRMIAKIMTIITEEFVKYQALLSGCFHKNGFNYLAG